MAATKGRRTFLFIKHFLELSLGWLQVSIRFQLQNKTEITTEITLKMAPNRPQSDKGIKKELFLLKCDFSSESVDLFPVQDRTNITNTRL